MILPGQLLQLYNQLEPVLKRLQARSLPLLQGIAKNVGGRPPETRIKPLDSLLLKIEKNGLERPLLQITDLFAATIVAPYEYLLTKIEEQVIDTFNLVEKLPARSETPEEFKFSDAQYLLRLKPDKGAEDPELERITFELQVKTEFQAASARTTRQFVYKTKRMSWTATRTASRVRALVEMLDEHLNHLAQQIGATEVDAYRLYLRRNQILDVLETHLPATKMPDDLRRLSIIIDGLLLLKKTSVEVLATYLGKAEHRSIIEALSISVGQTIFIILFLEGRLSSAPGEGTTLIMDPRERDRRFLITQEMIDLCPKLRTIPASRQVNLSLT